VIPVDVFGLALWAAYGFVALGAGWLLVVLVREWRSDELW
jgi:hypothetical protein